MGIKLTTVATPEKEENKDEKVNFSDVDLEGTDESTQEDVSTSGDSLSVDGSSELQDTEGDPLKKKKSGGIPKQKTTTSQKQTTAKDLIDGAKDAIETVRAESEMTYGSEQALPTVPSISIPKGLRIKPAEPTKQFSLDDNFKGKNEDDIRKYLEKQLPNYNVTVPFAPGEDKVLVQPKFSDDRGLYMTFSGNDLVGYKITEESITKLNNYLIDNETNENKDAIEVYDLITETPNAGGTYDDIELGTMFGIDFQQTSNADPEQALNLINIVDDIAADVYANPKKYLTENFSNFSKDIVEVGGLEGDYSLWPDEIKNTLDNIIYSETVKKFGREVETQAGAPVDEEPPVYDNRLQQLEAEVQAGVSLSDETGGTGQGLLLMQDASNKATRQLISGYADIPNRESFDRIINRTKGRIETKRNQITKDNYI